MTKREFLNAVIENVAVVEIVDFAKAEIEKMDARNAKRSSTPSKTQKENEPIKQKIADFVRSQENAVTASEIAKGLEISTQKASALCRQMVESDILTSADAKVKGKGTMKVYSIAQ